MIVVHSVSLQDFSIQVLHLPLKFQSCEEKNTHTYEIHVYIKKMTFVIIVELFLVLMQTRFRNTLWILFIGGCKMIFFSELVFITISFIIDTFSLSVFLSLSVYAVCHH